MLSDRRHRTSSPSSPTSAEPAQMTAIGRSGHRIIPLCGIGASGTLDILRSPTSAERVQMTAMTRDDGNVGDLPFLRLSYKDDANPLPGSSRRCRRYALGEQHLLRADHCGVHAPAEPSADDTRPGPAIFEPG